MLKAKKPALGVGQKSADALKSVLAVDLVKENRFKNLLRAVKIILIEQEYFCRLQKVNLFYL